MKKLTFLIILVTTSFVALYAQNKVTKKVQSGDDVNSILASSRFLFSEFQNAQVYLKGGMSNAMMNLNLLSGKMQFIDTKGDTLNLENVNDILVILVDKRSFKYTQKGFVEILASMTSEDIGLSVKRSIKYGDRKKYGAYGTVSETSSIDNISRIESSNEGVYKLTASEEISLKQECTYYLSKENKYVIANRSGFLKIFSKQKNAINDYLTQNSIDFKKEEDVLHLFNYCIGLAS